VILKQIEAKSAAQAEKLSAESEQTLRDYSLEIFGCIVTKETSTSGGKGNRVVSGCPFRICAICKADRSAA
jgi:hypothetical protein